MKWNEFFKMKRAGSLVWVLGCLLILGVSSVQAEQPCTLATLSGSYAITNSGFITVNQNEFVPFTSIGRLTFDGAGNYSGFRFTKDPSGFHKLAPSKGTYKVKPDCTGSLNPEGGRSSARLVIAHGGDEYYLIATGKGSVGMGTGRKQ